MKNSLILCVFALLGLVFFGAVQTVPALGSSVPPAQAAAQADALANMAAERDQLASDLAQATTRLDGVTAEMTALNVENTELAGTLSSLRTDLETQSATSAETDQTIADLNDAVSSGLQEQAALQARATALENTVAGYEAQIASLETASSRTAELEDTIAGYEAQISTLEAASSRAAELEDTIAGYEAQISTLEAAQTTQENTSSTASVALVAAQDRVAALIDVVAEQEIAASTSADDAARLTAELENLKLEIAQRDDQIASLSTTAAAPALSLHEQCSQLTNAVLDGQSIAFDSGSAVFAETSLPLLNELMTATLACAQDNMVLDIEGHTDNVGGVASNLLLSNARAQAVQDFFEAGGVPASALRSAGFGGSDPVSASSPEQNQRIVLFWKQN